MALIDEVKKICTRLAPYGWATLLKRHGLDITLPAKELHTELYRDISRTINRSIPGFTDFINSGDSGIQPYSPCKSLLFHAFASPNVHPTPGHVKSADEAAYPTIKELDTLENFIFSTEHQLLSGVEVRDKKFFESNFAAGTLVIATFAYQYRTGARTAHDGYADFAYSRTGISRVGTSQYKYQASQRGFETLPAKNSKEISVLPARYGVFIAELRDIKVEGDVLQEDVSDHHKYYFPVHKLFAGESCIKGFPVPDFDLTENHVSEKLKRLFLSLKSRFKVKTDFKINEAPFVRSSDTTRDLVTIEAIGASGLVVPKNENRWISIARQGERFVFFRVPPKIGNEDNRYSTSLQIENAEGAGRARIGPEYANIRFEDNGSATPISLYDEFPANEEGAFKDKITKGAYNSSVFTDNSCDGCVLPKFKEPFNWLKIVPAFSIVAAPDFFPLCDQSEIVDWMTKNNILHQFAQGGADPLYTTRKPVNPLITLPGSTVSAFDGLNKRSIKTTTAVVSMSVKPLTSPVEKTANYQISFLPDAASGYFAPGWDVTWVQVPEYEYTFLSTLGLGSPFPEDAKLCAALNSFWPAVAPDASRTFIALGNMVFKTALPLLDIELGYHPQHPEVIAGRKKASLGWDGEQGPYFEKNLVAVNYTSIDRSDYTGNALKNLFNASLLRELNATEWIVRMMAQRHCIFTLPPPSDRVSTTTLSTISVEKITEWGKEPRKANESLDGPGFIFQFAHLSSHEDLTSDRKRRMRKVHQSFTCHLSDKFLFWKDNSDKTYEKVIRSTIPRNG